MQHLILLVIVLLIVGLAHVPMRWPGGLHMTFSQHVARRRSSKIYYAVLFLVALPLLLWFFIEWLVPEKTLPSAFTWFVTVAVIFQIACTFVPETGGVKTIIHRFLAGASGVALLPLVLILATAQHLLGFARLTALGALVIMILLLVIALKHQEGHDKVLLLQIGYYAGFFVAILAATYIA